MSMSEMQQGWDFAAQILGANYAAQLGEKYVSTVEKEVQKLVNDMNALGRNALGSKQLKGFVAEYWHADTFNIEAALRDSRNRASVDGSTKHASVDISTNFGKNYSSKYIKTAEASVEAQAKNVIQAYHEYLSKPRKGEAISFDEYIDKYGYSKNENIKNLIDDYRKSVDNGNTSTLEQFMKTHVGEYDIATLLTSVYNGQDRLIPIDQIPDAIKYLSAEIKKEAGKETSNRAAVLANYKETLEKLVDRVSDGTGAESHTLTKEEAEAIAALIKEGKFKAEDFGLKLSDIITNRYILHQALKAGITTAVITLVMQLAPEIIKAVDYLIKNRKIDLDQIKKMGITAMTASAEGFLRGFISSVLIIVCSAGKLGETLKELSSSSVGPSIIGSTVVLIMQTIKNSILVAAGKMTAREMGTAFVDTVVISGGYLIGAQIGGIIGQAIGFELPVVGYLLGSLIGTAFSVLYNIGKNKFISFCVDTGFTCFGLVDQNYELPEEMLKELGVDTIPIPRANVDTIDIPRINVATATIERIQYETVGFTMVKRGVIGVNKVGYVLA